MGAENLAENKKNFNLHLQQTEFSHEDFPKEIFQENIFCLYFWDACGQTYCWPLDIHFPHSLSVISPLHMCFVNNLTCLVSKISDTLLIHKILKCWKMKTIRYKLWYALSIQPRKQQTKNKSVSSINLKKNNISINSLHGKCVTQFQYHINFIQEKINVR